MHGDTSCDIVSYSAAQADHDQSLQPIAHLQCSKRQLLTCSAHTCLYMSLQRAGPIDGLISIGTRMLSYQVLYH